MKILNKLILIVLTAALIVCMASCAKPDKPEPAETGKPGYGSYEYGCTDHGQ